MIDLDREMRALLEEDAQHTPPVPEPEQVLRRTRRRQVGVALATVAVVALVALGSVAGVAALIRSSERRVPAEPPDAFSPGALEAVPVGPSFSGLTVDADGVVWGTGAGLTRYDPESGSIRTFTVADDPVFGDVLIQGAARDGGVWIESSTSPDGTVRRFDGEGFISAPDVSDVLEGPDDTLYGVGCDGGCIVRREGQAWVPLPNDGRPDSSPGLEVFDASGALWVANLKYPGPEGMGVSRFDGATWRTWTTDDGLPSDDVITIVPGANGDVWVGTEDGAARFRGGSWTAYPTETIGMKRVTSIAHTEEGVVIAGEITDASPGSAGIARFDGSEWHAVTAEDGLDPSGSDWTEVASGTSGVWAATDAGLSRLDGTRWQLVVPAGSGPSTDTIRAYDASIAAADADTLWVASSRGGIRRLDGAAWTRFGVIDGLPSERVNDVAVARDGAVWAATQRGLARFDGSRWEEVVAGRHVAIAFAPGGTVWTARALETEGYGGLPPDTWTVGPVGGPQLPEPDSGVSAAVSLDAVRGSLAVGPGDDVWVGSVGSWVPGGLAHFDGEAWSIIDRPTIAPEYPRQDPADCGFGGCTAVPVTDIAVTPDGTVWVAFELWAGKADPSFAVAMFDGVGWRTYYHDAAGTPFVGATYRGGDLEVTADGHLLLASGNGLLEFRDGAWHLVEEGDFPRLSIAPDGTAWLGGDGLFRMRGA